MRTKHNKSLSLKSFTGHQAFLPSLLFLVLVATLAVSLTLSDNPPRIDAISPEIGRSGGVLVIEGANFGESRGRNGVSIGGVRPTTSSYLEWSNERISVQIPDEVTSGLVRVVKPSVSSNGVLFTNRKLIPTILLEKAEPGYPYIESISPTKGNVGSLITISGLNFGLSRGDGVVVFNAIPTGSDTSAGIGTTTASTLDFDYESWSEQTVRVRVPDGASSGNIRIITDRGTSNSQFFEIVRSGGEKRLAAKRGFQITLGVDVDNIVSDSDGMIEFWIPGPADTMNQRDIESVADPETEWAPYRGITRFRLTDIDPTLEYRYQMTYFLDRYAVETNINPSGVVPTYDTERRLYREYVGADAYVPADDEGLKAAARSAAGRQTNPYLIARNVFYFLLTQMSYERKSSAKSIADAFISARGDAEDYSLLLCAFLRSLGIPARPVTGILVYDTRKTIRHMWVEYYLEGFGWIPADPVLADGVKFGDFPEIENPEVYYFGSVDEQRVIFTKGSVDAFPVEAELLQESTVRIVDTVPSLQMFHELASPQIESYRARWSPVEVVDYW